MLPKLDLDGFTTKSLGVFRVDAGLLSRYQSRRLTVYQEFEYQRSRGKATFANLAYQSSEDLQPIFDLAEWAVGRFDSLVVIGVGGSIQGARMLYDALAEDETRFRLYFAGESLNAEELLRLVRSLDLKRTVFNIVSHSGWTTDTLVNFYFLQELVRQAVGDDFKDHFVFTTGFDDSFLRELSVVEQFRVLDIPWLISSRFSVFTVAGLFPALCAGLDIEGILSGARLMDQNVTEFADNNDVTSYALYHYIAMEEMKRSVNLLMSYHPRLKEVGLWWQQLWSGTLSKQASLQGETVRAGLTPLVMMGPSDQHALLQLPLSGPTDKTVSLVTVQPASRDWRLPTDLDPRLQHLAGQRMGDILTAEEQVTKIALVQAGQPTAVIALPGLGNKTIGALIYFFQLATVQLANLMQVDPYSQLVVDKLNDSRSNQLAKK